ncbi:MAG: DUF971 domain-containing protein [Planctomycetaceae bacterium]
MTDSTLTPVALKGNAQALTIEWSDGVVHTLPWRKLRDACPCATCRGERSAPQTENDDLLPIITPAEAQPLTASEMHAIGNYAYGIHFSDGHATGIYSLELLRSLGE